MLDNVKNLVGQSSGANSNVAGGLMQSLDEHSGGLSGIIDNFRNNGMGDHVAGWASGQQTTATPDQIQQGLGGSGFIERVAAKARISPEAAKTGLAVMLPIVIAHFHSGGQTVPQSGFGGTTSHVLGKSFNRFGQKESIEMADFQALQQKYAPVVEVIKKFESYGAKFLGSDLVGEQYHFKAEMPSRVVLERAWDEIKKIDPQ